MAKPKLAPAPAPAPAPEAADPAPPQKSKKKLIIVVLAALLVLGGGGGGAAWFFLKKPAAEGDKHEAAAKEEKKAPPTFVTLDPFTVNLLEENGDHYLQVGIVYQVSDGKFVDTMKQYMPILRNKILLALSSKHPSDIATLEGKQKLVAELVAAARETVPGTTPEHGIDGAFLSSFVIQ